MIWNGTCNMNAAEMPDIKAILIKISDTNGFLP